MDNDIIFITAYKDIGRNTWHKFNRSNEIYFNNFILLCNNIKYTLLVYIENNIREQILINYSFNTDNIIFKDYHSVSTYLDKYLKNDKIIMSSDIYKDKIPPHRKNNPEHIYSEYNLVNHNKINFVSDAKKTYPNYAFYSWIDFGYIQDIESVPQNINTHALPHKIIYQCINIPINYINPNEMLANDIIFITGSAFIIHRSLVDYFEIIYEQKIIEWQKNYISDDDQNLVLQLYYENSHLFHLIQNYIWFLLYNILPNSI